MTINIREEFKEDYTTRIAGERLRNMILNSKEKIILNFSEIKIASASFFDEGIAKLALEGWTTQKLRELVAFEHLYSMDQKLLEQVCKARGLDP